MIEKWATSPSVHQQDARLPSCCPQTLTPHRVRATPRQEAGPPQDGQCRHRGLGAEGSVHLSLYLQLSERLPAQPTTSGRVAVESALVGLGVAAVSLCVDVAVSLLHIGR